MYIHVYGSMLTEDLSLVCVHTCFLFNSRLKFNLFLLQTSALLNDLFQFSGKLQKETIMSNP